MHDRRYYLYAMTWANCSAADFGPGVDPRFAVELTQCGPLAALTSRVGLDRFDIGKLQAGSADVRWLSEVAVRHHEVVAKLAESWPVLPLRMGTLFDSQISLRARMAQHEAQAADFLRRLGDRQEWALKVYLGEQRAEQPQSVFEKLPLPLGEGRGEGTLNRPSGSALTLTLSQGEREASATSCAFPPSSASSSSPRSATNSSFPPSSAGTQYLAAKRLRTQRRQEVQATAQRALPALEARLQTFADAWQRLRPLPAALTGRAEKMVYHSALLLRRCRRQAFGTTCDELERLLAPEGLIVELSGPWPPYHFCPALQQST